MEQAEIRQIVEINQANHLAESKLATGPLVRLDSDTRLTRDERDRVKMTKSPKRAKEPTLHLIDPGEGEDDQTFLKSFSRDESS